MNRRRFLGALSAPIVAPVIVRPFRVEDGLPFVVSLSNLERSGGWNVPLHPETKRDLLALLDRQR